MRTAFDQMLVKMATRHVIYVMSLPTRSLGQAIRVEPIKALPGWEKYSYKLTADDNDAYLGLARLLRSESKLFDPAIETKPGWSWAVEEGSRTYDAAWGVVSIVSAVALIAFGISQLPL